MHNQKESFQRARASAGHWGKARNKKETAGLNVRSLLTMPEITELSDQALLSQTRRLVQNERSLHVQVLRHLREIEARRLYFSEGYASLFDCLDGRPPGRTLSGALDTAKGQPSAASKP